MVGPHRVSDIHCLPHLAAKSENYTAALQHLHGWVSLKFTRILFDPEGLSFLMIVLQLIPYLMRVDKETQRLDLINTMIWTLGF